MSVIIVDYALFLTLGLLLMGLAAHQLWPQLLHII